MFRHKNIRLGRFNYVGRQCCFVTLCCLDRRPVFVDCKRCVWLLEKFRAESASRSFAIHAYCIMPDHFHFLAEGMDASSDLLMFVKGLKIKTGRQYQAENSQALWQKKFFDHILRSHESPEAVAWYIWSNPVRRGLSAVVGEYPFAGSFTDLAKRIPSAPTSWIPPWRSKAPASEGGCYNS